MGRVRLRSVGQCTHASHSQCVSVLSNVKISQIKAPQGQGGYASIAEHGPRLHWLHLPVHFKARDDPCDQAAWSAKFRHKEFYVAYW